MSHQQELNDHIQQYAMETISMGYYIPNLRMPSEKVMERVLMLEVLHVSVSWFKALKLLHRSFAPTCTLLLYPATTVCCSNAMGKIYKYTWPES